MPPHDNADDSYGVDNHTPDLVDEFDPNRPVGEMIDAIREANDQLKETAAQGLDHVIQAENIVIEKEEVRKMELAHLQNELDNLVEQREAAHAAAQRPEGVPSHEEHVAHAASLDTQIFAAGKALNDEKAGVTKREVELGRLKTEREEVRKWDVGAEGGDNTKPIRLRMLTDLGFNVASHDPIKLFVRNDRKPDVNTVTVDPARPVHFANLLWDLAGE